MTDILGLRVICLYEDDVEVVRAAIAKEFDVLDTTDKVAQIEGTENTFGYKGVHLDLRMNAERGGMAEYRHHAEHPFELQIRTVIQHSWSVLDHRIKYKKSIPNRLKRRINTLAALFELADREFLAVRDATQDELQQAESSFSAIELETTAVESEHLAEDPAAMRFSSALNVFTFLRIAQHFFPLFEFEPHKVDGFTQDVVGMQPDITRADFNLYLRTTI